MLLLLLSCSTYFGLYLDCQNNYECAENFGQGSVCQSDGYCSDIRRDDDNDGLTGLQGDCNDEDPTIYPGAVEILNDKIDQDCTGYDATWEGQACSKMPEQNSETVLHEAVPDLTFKDQFGMDFNLHSICDSVVLLRIFKLDNFQPASLQQLEDYWVEYRENSFFSVAVVMDDEEGLTSGNIYQMVSDYGLTYPVLRADFEKMAVLRADNEDKYILLNRGGDVVYMNVNPPSSSFIQNWM